MNNNHAPAHAHSYNSYMDFKFLNESSFIALIARSDRLHVWLNSIVEII